MNETIKRIAIASEKDDIESVVCATAGRAPYYLIFENKTLVKSIKNPFAKGSGGAGFSVAQMLANENVNLVIAGKLGQNMIPALDEKEIKYLEIQNRSIKQVLEELE